MNEETMVTDNPGEVDESTLTPGVEGQPSTPSTTSDDAELNIESIQADYEEKFSKLNQDLNAMKSTFQKRESQREREWQQRESQYKQQIEELRLSTMDDEQRKSYEATASARRAAELEQQLQQIEAERYEQEAINRAQNYFLSLDVPITALNLDEGYDALWASGLDYLTAELAEYRKSKQAPQTKQTAKTVSAPPVVTTNNAPASSGMTWDALKKRLNVTDDEEIYRMFETGQLDPSLIPSPGKT